MARLLDNPKDSQQQLAISWKGNIAGSLLLTTLEGCESLSAPFTYRLSSTTLCSETDVARFQGTSVSCQIGESDSDCPPRYLHGVVTHIMYDKRGEDEAECILTLEPSFALLSMGRMMRIWQNISVPELVRTLLSESGINDLDMRLYGSYPKREYCVQYRESAFDFIERLLEEEGICYFFRHSESAHTLILADHPSSHPEAPGEPLPWRPHGSGRSERNINSWLTSASIPPDGVTLQGYNMPQAAAIEDSQDASGSGVQVPSFIFNDITPQGERTLISREAQNALAAREANTQFVTATTNAHWLSCGEVFSFSGHPSGDSGYRIRSLKLRIVNNLYGSQSMCECRLEAISNNLPWRPPVRLTPPTIPGVLTAIVVGPSSEDIHTDEYGRIKIQFPWDKENPHDDTSSCWVRVAQPWSGAKFGAQFIPRIGSEVLVSFIQGHPDFPLVTGTIYNGQNKPPFALPGEKNESGFITRSCTKGNIDEGHRLSFNDTKGEELLTVIAQKDLLLQVKNNATTSIAANRSTELIKGDDTLSLKEGNMLITLNSGNWQQDITGDASTRLTQGDYALNVAGGGGSIKTDKALTLESSQSVELKVGSNTLTLSSTGISINGMAIKIESSSTAELKGLTTTISGSTLTTIDGALIRIG